MAGEIACEREAIRDHVQQLIRSIKPLDTLEALHLLEADAWVGSGVEWCRRQRWPVVPRQHLVSYFLLIDDSRMRLLLGDHVSSGLWLPSGGHVELGESPYETVRRECMEELQVEAGSHPATGDMPAFLTITESNGEDPHRDVSLWYVLSYSKDQPLVADPREYRSVRWWTIDEVREAEPTSFDPHLFRMLRKLDNLGVWQSARQQTSAREAAARDA